MFQPSKFALVFSQVKRIEPEILECYRENDWRNKSQQNIQNDNGMEAPRSGRSTPEIEVCAKSTSQDLVEQFGEFAASLNINNAEFMQGPATGRNNRRVVNHGNFSAMSENGQATVRG